MILSKRLQAVADMVTPGYVLADIGTDHGYVPIELIKRGTCPFAIAMDINEGPLLRARAHIQEQGLSDEEILVRQSDGLEQLAAGEADAILIAGMGGPLILRLIQEGIEKIRRAKELILSPHSEWSLVREGLKQWNLAVIEERMLLDEGKYYQIWRIVPWKEELSDIYGASPRLTEELWVHPFTGVQQAMEQQQPAKQPGAKQPVAKQQPMGQPELEKQAVLAYGGLLLRDRDPVLHQYLQQEQNKLKDICRHLTIHKQESEAAFMRLQDIQNKLAVNETAMRRYIEYEMQ